MNRPSPIEFLAFMFRIGFLERSKGTGHHHWNIIVKLRNEKNCDTILKIVSFIVTIKWSRDLYMKFHV